MEQNLLNEIKNQKIKRSLIKDKTYEILNNWIVTGKLKPESKININELSEVLGISRTPVREAILKLEENGLVLSKANSWTIVAPIDLKEAKDSYPIVSSLECLALKIGFEKITEEDITELKYLNAKVKLAIDSQKQEETLEADNEFHKKIISLSGNLELYPIIENLKNKFQRIELYFFENVDNKFNSFEEHAAIIEAIKEKDLEKSINALKINWENSLELLYEKAKFE